MRTASQWLSEVPSGWKKIAPLPVGSGVSAADRGRNVASRQSAVTFLIMETSDLSSNSRIGSRELLHNLKMNLTCLRGPDRLRAGLPTLSNTTTDGRDWPRATDSATTTPSPRPK